jgi:serine/threonine protein kinase
MELLDGETLEQRWLRNGSRLAPAEVLSIADQVLDVLAAAHDKGIIHRDLKPENLFLTTSRIRGLGRPPGSRRARRSGALPG